MGQAQELIGLIDVNNPVEAPLSLLLEVLKG